MQDERIGLVEESGVAILPSEECMVMSGSRSTHADQAKIRLLPPVNWLRLALALRCESCWTWKRDQGCMDCENFRTILAVDW